MRLSYAVRKQWTMRAILSVMLLAVFLLTSACGGNAQIRQRATGGQARFMKQLQHAEQIGIPSSMLQPVLQRQDQLAHMSPPSNPFDDQALNGYYNGLSNSYDRLTLQLNKIISNGSEQLQTQAQQNYEQAQVVLKQREGQGLPAQNFLPQLRAMQGMLQQARLPKDYAAVSIDAKNLESSLQLLSATADQLTALKKLTGMLKSANLNTDAAQNSYDLSSQLFSHVSSPATLQALNIDVHAQYQQANVMMMQGVAFLVPDKLNALNEQIKQLVEFNIPAGTYQSRLAADQALVHKNMTLQDYQAFSTRVDADITAVQSALLRPEAQQLLNQFHQEAQSWGNAHAYHDSYDGKNYPLDVGYLSQGIGSDMDSLLVNAVSEQDLRSAISTITDALFNLKMMELDSTDTTPYDQVHSADTQLFDHYQMHSGQVIVISLAQQALRLYQDGKLVRAFQVVTGRPELPSPPGVWSVLNRQAPTTFISSDPPDSPYWYPPTHINYAIMFQQGGYYIHDAWWRANFGPGNQFPHYDTSGDEADSGTGSHGCVNMSTSDAEWLYNNTSWDAKVIVF